MIKHLNNDNHELFKQNAVSELKFYIVQIRMFIL